MYKGSCHCGAVEFVLNAQPEHLTECNCSICRRIGALWAHSEITNIEVICGDNATMTYVQGDKKLAIHTCRSCGCTTHWENLAPEESPHMAVNCRMIDAADIADIPIRQFDGADTWTYLD